MLEKKHKTSFKYFCLMMLIYASAYIDSAHAVFGQSGVDQEEYYKCGQSYTGVAAVHSDKGGSNALGTANLIETDNEALKGRVLITAAHVLQKGTNRTVRFTDENNVSHTVPIERVYFEEDYKEKDIALIVLRERVDTEKYKPLKLNFTRTNESLVGSDIKIIGCSPLIGTANSQVVVRQEFTGAVRRGMETKLHHGSEESPLINYVFHHHAGFLAITRKEKTELFENEEMRTKKEKIAEELEEIKKELEMDNSTEEEKKAQQARAWSLVIEERNLSKASKRIVRAELKKTTLLCDALLESTLDSLEGADDLDRTALIKHWNQFIAKKDVDGRDLDKEDYFERHIQLGEYGIDMTCPLPLLSGCLYHGDSGGAWIIDEEIMAITAASRDVEYNPLVHYPESSANYPSLEDYFKACEIILKGINTGIPLLNRDIKKDEVSGFGTSVWSCRDWLQSTLERIAKEHG